MARLGQLEEEAEQRGPDICGKNWKGPWWREIPVIQSGKVCIYVGAENND
jgi:hypothetical protein